jgi:glycogen(starch) synthase
MVRRARVVTACSEFTLRGLEEFARITPPARVVFNGVDPDEARNTLDEETGFGRYVLAVGRLVPQKGFDVLIDAFASAELDDLELVLAGEGFEHEPLDRRAAALGLADRVHLIGAVDRARLGALLRGARVFAFPSRDEPFGIALLEAMAAGVPAVASAAGGVTEFASDGENALLIPSGDAHALARALARAANDEPLRRRLREGGRATARRLSWEQIASVYEDLYADALRDDDDRPARPTSRSRAAGEEAGASSNASPATTRPNPLERPTRMTTWPEPRGDRRDGSS